MILVDTTVWIDFLKGQKTPWVSAFEKSITDRVDIYICGVIKMEILQGLDTDKEYKLVRDRLDICLNALIHESTYLMAAMIYRKSRSNGYTIRKSIDCLIAATAIENKLTLLHHDKDFDFIEKSTTLKNFKLVKSI